jgi:tetratricopeptide (TPR) repeat protein
VHIFLSHASEQADVAESIAIALRSEGHVVFLDRSSLPSGDAYNDRIREAIADCDLFIFLVSPEAVTRGRYTLSELEFVEQKWGNPSDRVLPVVVRATELASIPAYLRAVTLLDPQGNIPAAVAATVARLSKPRWHQFLRHRAAVVTLLVFAMIGGAGFLGRWMVHQRALGRETSALLEAGRLQEESHKYSAAWDTYAKAAALTSHRADIVALQERLAMDWLENIRVTSGRGTFTAIVEAVEPVLARCAASKESQRAADCQAHIGWGDFLRSREGDGGLDPARQYRLALERDPDNVYGHAMWGFETLRREGPLEQAKEHFARALASKRERIYVRHIQIAGLLWRHDADAENEVVRVANDMRTHGERVSEDEAGGSELRKLWGVYYDRLLYRHDLERFLTALSPPDHLATFRWLFPETAIAADKQNLRLFMLATFEERAGQRTEALATYSALRDVLVKEGTLARGGPLSEDTVAAIKRLSK